MHPRLQRPCKFTVRPSAELRALLSITPDLPFSTCPPDVHSLPHTHPDRLTLRIQPLICSLPFHSHLLIHLPLIISQVLQHT